MNKQIKTKSAPEAHKLPETRALPANTPSTKMESSNWIILTVVIIMAISVIGFLYVAEDNSTSSVSKSDTICIAENSVFYGTEWCSFCQKQKEMFGTNVELLNYIDCDYNRSLCEVAGIEGFPTWDINEQRYVGLQPIEKLKELTGC